jgi:cell filamentation protein
MFDWLQPKPEMSEFDKHLISSNLVGAKNLSELNEKERLITDAKTRELKANPIQGNLDYKHLKEIHKYLFQDVYVWAGMDRYEIGIRGDFRKGDTHFTTGNKLPDVANDLFGALKAENYFKNLTKTDFVKNAAVFMNGLNIYILLERVMVEHNGFLWNNLLKMQVLT